MGRDLYKLTTSFDDVIKMRQLKNSFRGFSLNISKTDHQTYVTFRQSYIEVFEIERL